jgi:septum site-determining protein MinD
MTKLITLIGGKGGCGKTTATINLGAALTKLNKNVSIIDANLTTPNIGVYLGVPEVPVSLHHVIQGKKHISEATYLHPSGLKIIPGSLALSDLKNTDPIKLENSLLDLLGTVDLALVDAAAGLGREALSSIKAADSIIIVTNPEIPALTDALKTIKVAEELNTPILGILLNRVKRDGLDIPLLEVQEMLELPVIGIIPEDNNVRKAMFSKTPVVFSHPESPASMAYKRVAATLIGESPKEPSIPSRASFISSILRLFRFKI